MSQLTFNLQPEKRIYTVSDLTARIRDLRREEHEDLGLALLALGLAVDRRPQRAAAPGEHDRHELGAAIGRRGGEPRNGPAREDALDLGAFELHPDQFNAFFQFNRSSPGSSWKDHYYRTTPTDEFKVKLPKAFGYLLANKKFLEQRENGRMYGGHWYGFVYPKNLDVMKVPKLLVPDSADSASFAFDESGDFAFTSGYGITLKPTTKESFQFILGLANSRVLDFYWRQISTPLRGGLRWPGVRAAFRRSQLTCRDRVKQSRVRGLRSNRRRRSEKDCAAVPDPLHQPAAALLAFALQRLRPSGGTPEEVPQPSTVTRMARECTSVHGSSLR
jgi:hypothetical protein